VLVQLLLLLRCEAIIKASRGILQEAEGKLEWKLFALFASQLLFRGLLGIRLHHSLPFNLNDFLQVLNELLVLAQVLVSFVSLVSLV
jgi:hypothetical protein